MKPCEATTFRLYHLSVIASQLKSSSADQPMSSSYPGPTASTPLLHAQAGPSHLRPGPASPALSYTDSLDPSASQARPLLSPLSKRRRKASPIVRVLPGILILAIFTAFVFVAWDVSSVGACYVPWLCRILGKSKWRDDEVFWRNTGAYAPFRSRGTGGGQINLPRGCVIDQVNVVSCKIRCFGMLFLTVQLHRHAARYPTSSSGESMQKALDKLKTRTITSPRRDDELNFLNQADLDMKGWRFDELMDQGRKA